MTLSRAQATIGRAERVLRDQVLAAVYPVRVPLEVAAWEAPGEPVPFARAVAADYEPFAVPSAWGAPWSTTWFRLRGEVPATWAGGAFDNGRFSGVLGHGAVRDGLAAELVVDLGFTGAGPGFQAEGLLWRPDGTVVKGIAPLNDAVGLPDAGPFTFYLEAAANPGLMASGHPFDPTPLGDKATAGSAPLYTLRAADLVRRDIACWQLAQDLTALIGLTKELPPDSVRFARLVKGLADVCTAIDPQNVAGSVPAAEALLAPLLAQPAHASAHTVVATGHSHLDSAWLWPVRETIRKAGRTLANALSLIEAHPQFTFAFSSAQQYAWVKKYYPDVYAGVKKAVEAGRLRPVGSMWVEADTNIPGGEALVRQLVLGKEFFLREFGVETLDAWLPDSFGYTGALPQLIRASGGRWFLTNKMSWNDTDTMPHQTFFWEGIDGSRVLTHFLPAENYGVAATAHDLVFEERNFIEKATLDKSLMLYGWSDGGGGATREMVASVERFHNLEGAPKTVFGDPYDVFEEAERHADELATWSGEMYLELHRGSYTSQLRSKQGNRRSEHLLREAELWAATAAVREGAEYPYDRLREAWETVLLDQFHDTLPGSGIAWVNADARADYARVAEALESVVGASLEALAGAGTVELTANAAPQSRGGVPALALGPATGKPAVSVSGDPAAGVTLANERYRVHITPQGRIDSAFDKRAGREAVPAGMLANLYQLHRDTPRQWDAWDIDDTYRDTVEDLAGRIAGIDEATGTVSVDYRFGDSVLRQRITLLPGDAGLQLATYVDWHERRKLLKLAFPCDLFAKTSASEIQFGHLERPTHCNTSWDQARYEICAQRWIRVAEGDFGVGLANDSTYGHDVTTQARPDGSVVTIVRESLIRSQLFPDPQADQGEHELVTVYLPGASLAETIDAGYAANLRPRAVRGAHPVEPLVGVDDPGVKVEAVKLAQDRSGDVIVRLYEAFGRRTQARVTANFATTGAQTTDLLERPDGAIRTSGGPVGLALRPFELVTLRFARP